MSVVATPHTELNRALLSRDYAIMFGSLGLIVGLIAAAGISEKDAYKRNAENLPSPFWLVPLGVVGGIVKGIDFGKYQDSIGVQYISSVTMPQPRPYAPAALFQIQI
jgi:hypothetical protein